MKKINLVLFKYSLEVGGAEKQLLRLANHLYSESFNIFVIVRNYDNDLKNQFAKNEKIIFLPKKSFLNSVLFLRSVFKKNRINICHCWDFKSSIWGFFATLFSNVYLIDGSIRSAPSSKMRFYYFYKIKYLILRIFGIPIVSNSEAGLLCYGLNRYKKSHIVHNAFLPVKNIENESNMDNKFKIGMLANMRWKKDFMTFIKAGLEVLKINRNVKFYLIGDGPDKEKYINFLQNNHLKSHFIFTGFQADPGNYIKQMDICALINNVSGEGLSNSIMEYMAHAKPVVATDLGGNNELVKNNETGYLVKENDHIEIAEKLKYLLANPDERKKMGKNGLEFISRDFSIEKMVANYSSIYREIAAKDDA